MHVMASLSRTGAGVYEAVQGTTRALTRDRLAQVTVVGAVDAPHDWPADREAWERAGAKVVVVPRSTLRGEITGRLRIAAGDLHSVDVVHGHGLWCGASLTAAALARGLTCPLVISPHGMLEPWARHHHRLRKQFAWIMQERAAVGGADLLQAMSDLELESLRAARLFQPIAVHPVGIDVPRPLLTDADHGKAPNRSCRTCVFLSRLHPKKGLAILLRAWCQVQPRGWRLVIAGPDHRGHRAAMVRLAHGLGIDGSVVFSEPLHGGEKWQLLASADLFVLPSHSENFGIVIAEALAAGTPVIATTGTPWEVLSTAGAGWWVPTTAASLAAALQSATQMPADALLTMGDRGRELIRTRCDWSMIAVTVRDAYRWIVRGGPTPSAVRFAEGQVG